MRVALLRVAVLSVGSMMCAIFGHAQTSTFSSVPQLFYEDTTASQRVITQLAVDNAGNVVSFTVQTGLDCGFGICGAVVYSIAPDGSLNWVTPAPNYVAHAVNQIAIASDNSIFFQDQFATQEIMGLTPTGSIAPGWPVALGSDLDTANSTLLIDPIDQSIFAKGGAASAFEPPLTRTASFRQDGTTKWVADFPTGAFNTPGMILGPNGNVYTFTDRTVLLDRSDGHTICAFPVLGGDTFSPITGGDGLVFSYSATQVLRSDSGCVPFSIYNWDTNRHGFLISYDHGILFAEDLPNNGVPGTPRFIALSKDGVLLWANDLINPLSVAAVSHGLVYVVGIDTNAICCSQQKLFVLDGSNGNILTSLDITAVCPACVKVAVGSSGAYVADLSSTRIYKVNEIRPVWPMTGHDAQRTGRSTFVGPTNAPISPSWIFKSGGPIIGDIVISVDGIIYFTSDKLYALNPNGTDYAPAVAITPITSPAVDDVNGFIYVIANSSGGGYDVLRYSKQLQDANIVYHGSFKFVTPTSMIIGPDGTLYFSDGVSIIAVGAKNWETPFDPCFGNPAFLTPALGRDGSVYSMCQPGGGAGMGSGIYRFDGNTGSQIAFAPYSRGGTELLIDDQNKIRAGFQAFDGITFGGSYDSWDLNLNQLTITNPFDPTTSRSALMPDGTSTVRIGFSFQTNELDATGAHIWGISSGAQTLPNFSTAPTIDASGNVFVGTVSGIAALSGIDGSTIWFSSLGDTITTQPAISSGGSLIVGSSSGTVYAFDSKLATGTIAVSTNNTAATFTIAGPVTYLGNGTSFTQTNAPPGTYTITYGGVPCYTTPQSETLTLDAGGTIHFGTANRNGGTYSGSTTVSVNITPSTAAASFSISPSVQGLNTAGPYPVTVTSAVPQSYTVTFNDVSGFITPSPQTAFPSNLCSIYFSANYLPLAASTAQLSIALNTDKGGFSISSLTDPSGFKTISALTKQAALFGPISLPIGDYKIRFAAVTGYYLPATQTFTLTAGANLSIRGLYQRLFFIGFTGFTNAPHDTPSTVDCVFGHKTGNGIQFVRPEPGAGITQIVPEIEGDLGSPALQPGLRGASFTFYGTLDGKQQDGDACTPPILPPDLSVHYEAEQWLKGQHPTVWDKVVIAGHSYGGNRARLFSEQIKKDLQLNTDLLITVDAVDWTKCSLASVLFTGDSFGDAARNCAQASFAAGAIPPTRALSAYSFFQTAGIHVAGGDFPFPTGYIVPNAQSQLVDNVFHDTIDDQPNVHGKIRDLMLNVIRQDTIVVEAGDLSRNLTTLTLPITLSVTGLGEAHNIAISHATLANTSAVNLADGSSIGDIPSGASKAITFYFPVVTSGTAVDIAISGTYDNGRIFSSMIHSTVP